MRSVRLSVCAYMQACGIQGVTSARLKRMQAIRRKLRRSPTTLEKLQDLGGCRVILPTMADVQRLTDILRERARHVVRRERDYIATPKIDGFRSHHMMFDYQGRSRAPQHNGIRIELQVRTQLQHSWATAVEGVGLFRGEDLKGHKGNEDWLKLFCLMSAEFAEAEGCPVLPDGMDRIQRIKEIQRLERRLDALAMLDNVGNGVRGTDFSTDPSFKPSHYLIRYDNSTKQVRVDPYNKPKDATIQYDNAEA